MNKILIIGRSLDRKKFGESVIHEENWEHVSIGHDEFIEEIGRAVKFFNDRFGPAEIHALIID